MEQNYSDNGISPGFSSKCNDPELLKGVNKTKNIIRITMAAMAALPIIVGVILGVTRGNARYLGAGIAISVIILVVEVITGLKNRMAKQWDGVIIDKYTKVHSSHDNDNVRTTTTYYYIKAQKDDGKIIKNRVPYQAIYDYLNVDDRVRFHPNLNNYYEKYDKSRDTFFVCPACLTKNDVENDRCAYCNVPLLK